MGKGEVFLKYVLAPVSTPPAGAANTLVNPQKFGICVALGQVGAAGGAGLVQADSPVL